MRSLYLSFLLALVVNVALGATVGDYRSSQTGPWNQASTWQTFNGTTWVAAASTPVYTDGVITIRSGHTVNIPNGVTITADQIEYDTNGGGVLVVDAGGTLIINDGTGDDVRLFNDFSNVGLMRVSGTLTLNAGATMIDDDYAGSPGPPSKDTYKILNGGVHNHLVDAVIVAQIPNVDWQAGSTCQVTPVGA